MKLNNKEFDVLPEKEEEFFSYLDTKEKEILSTDVEKDGIPDYDREKFCIYEVSNHALLLPKEVIDGLSDIIIYID